MSALKGKKQTLEHIRKRVKTRLARGRYNHLEETREKIRKSVKEYNLSPGVRKRKSDVLKGRKQSSKSNLKRSRGACLAIKEGRMNPSANGRKGIGGWFYSHKNKKKIHYRSLLERDWYQLLEQMSIVKKYSIEPVAIPYLWEGSIHTYLPDLRIRYTDGTTELIEIKPEYLWEDKQNQAKWEAARKWCGTRRIPTTFKIVGCEELKRKGGYSGRAKCYQV